MSHGWKQDCGIDHSTSTLYSAFWFTPAVPPICGSPKFPFHVPFSFPFDSPLTIWGKTPKPMDVAVAALFQDVRRRLLGPCSRANRVPTCLRRGMKIRTHASSRPSTLKAITHQCNPESKSNISLTPVGAATEHHDLAVRVCLLKNTLNLSLLFMVEVLWGLRVFSDCVLWCRAGDLAFSTWGGQSLSS